MRKILIIVLIVLLLIAGYFSIFKGLNILGIEIPSVFGIKDKSDSLDTELERLTTLTSVDRPKAMSDLNNSAKQLVIARDEYNEKVLYSSEEEIKEATQGIQYEMEYLWTKVGNHATKNGIVLKFTVSRSSLGVSGLYDISFVATGKYVSISEFIAALENDSSLNFKIENFVLNPTKESTEILQATFTVKEISIKTENIRQTTTDTTTTDTKSGKTNS